MTVEEIRAALQQNERDRQRLSGELARATDAAQLAYDTYKQQESVPEGGSFFINSVRYDDKNDYLNALYADFEQKAATRRQIAVDFNALFPEKERLEAELDTALEAGRQQSTDAAAQRDQGPGTTSAGDEVQNATEARDEGALTQNPPSPPVDEEEVDANQPTNAQPSVTATPDALDPPSKLASATVSTAGNINQINNSTVNSLSGVDGLQTGIPQSSTQNYVYKMVTCTSRFSAGKFTQELEGALLIFPDGIPKTANAQQTQQGPDQSNAETARLARQNTAAASSNPRSNIGAAGNPGATDTGEIPGVTVFGSSLATDPGEIPGVTVSDRLQTDPGVPVDSLNDPAVLAQAENSPPTSGNQSVSLANNNQRQGLPADPSVPVFLSNGTVRQVTSQEEIGDLFAANQISRQEYLQARRGLQIKQELNTPSATDQQPQNIARET